MTETELIYDWNRQGEAWPTGEPTLVDHTLNLRSTSPQGQAEVLAHLRALGVESAQPMVRRDFPESFEDLPTDGGRLLLAGAGQAEPGWVATGLEAAWKAGYAAVCLGDDRGHCLRTGARSLVRFAQTMREHLGAGLRLEWWGGNQHGLALSNALEAWRQGIDAVHGAIFGLDDMLPSELWLVNLLLYGASSRDLSGLKALCEATSLHCAETILPNRPVVGADAFRTGTGVHAAAIIKAQAKGDEWLADLVYSGVPAAAFGYRQLIEVGPMAGASNVTHWLRSQGLEADPESVQRILARAKASDRVLSDEEIRAALANPCG